MPKPLCASGGQILLNPSLKLEKQLENLLYSQPVVSGTLCMNKKFQGDLKPFLLTQGALCCFIPFPTTLSIRILDKKYVVRMALSTSLLPRRIKYKKDPNSAQLL